MRTLKTLLGLIEESQKHIITEALYFTKDTHSSKEDVQKAKGGPSRPSQGRPTRSHLNRGKKIVFEQFTFLIITRREILNQVEELNILKKPSLIRLNPHKRDHTKYY